MNEPTLESISDYNTLEGEKKKIVWAVIFTGLIIGTIYSVSYKIFNNSEDAIATKDKVIVVPLSHAIPVR